MERNTLIDRLKGYACFLVLFGHVILGIRNAGIPTPSFFHGLETFIWTFHVALFLFLSGAVYTLTGSWQKQGSKGRFILHKLWNLGVPYFAFSIVYILINSLVGEANTRFSMRDILFLWSTPVAQYWYLYALFFLFCIWVLLAEWIKPWLLTLFLWIAGYLLLFTELADGSIGTVVYSSLAFGLGTFTNIACVASEKPWKKLMAVALHIVIGVILIVFGMTEKPLIQEGFMILGIASSIALISLLERYRPVAKFLDFMNRYSFQIYLLHTIFTAGIRIVLMKIGIMNWGIHMIIGTAFGLGCSVLAAVIAKKIKVLNFFFFPERTVSNWKKKPDLQKN